MADKQTQPTSMCPNCGKVLKPRDVLGFKPFDYSKRENRRYQCRHCKAAICVLLGARQRRDIIFHACFVLALLIPILSTNLFDVTFFKQHHVFTAWAIVFFTGVNYLNYQLNYNRRFQYLPWHPHCVVCDYDMRDLPDGSRCPECGGQAQTNPESRWI